MPKALEVLEAPKQPEAPQIDWFDWMATRLQIIDMQGRRLLLEPNKNQIRLFATIERQQAAGLPVRIIILKGRKSGMSTAVGARFYTEVANRPNRSAFVCAHDADSSDVLFRMVKIFDESLPREERKPQDYSSKKELVWSIPHYSSYRVQTAGKLQLRRGDTIFYLHISELAFYVDASTTLTAVFEAMAKTSDTMVVIESTANGQGGEFYERWERAVARLKRDPNDLNGFMPIFISWLDDDQNQMDVPAGYDWDQIDPEIAEGEPRLREMCAELGLDREQTDRRLYWRRWKILEDMNGELDRFMQEMPSTPEEAFLVSGRPAIARNIIEHHERLVKPGRKARLVLADQHVDADWNEEHLNNYWEVWEEPQPGRDYIVYGDVSEGRLSDPANPKSNPDRHAGGVLDRSDLRVVATFISPRRPGGSPLDPDLFGTELLKAAWWYNTAWASPEMNSCGMAALAAMRGYPKLYLREKREDSLGVVPLAYYGYRTDGQNRDLMIDECIAVCRPDPMTGFDDRLQHYCKELVDEEKTFIIDRSGKRQHRPGCHDDLWMMLCGLIQLHRRCPRARKSVFEDATWNRKRRRRRLSMAYDGGHDPGLGMLSKRRATRTR